MKTDHFYYKNTEFSRKNSSKTVRKVSIHQNKGTKTVILYRGGKKVHSVKKPISKIHIEFIKLGKFVPGLFSDCKCGKTRKRRS